MSYKVIRRFRDKYTRVIYHPGDTFASDEADRIRDLIQRRLIEGVVEELPPVPPANRKGNASDGTYQRMTKAELMELLKQKGIECSIRQTKAELIKLLQGGD